MASVSCARNASFAFFFVAFVAFVIAFSTPYWTTFKIRRDRYYIGVWRQCINSLGDCSPRGNIDEDELGASAARINLYISITRAMLSISLISQCMSFVMYCVWVSKNERYLREKRAGPVGLAALVLALIGGVLNLVGVCIYRESTGGNEQYASWSYWAAWATSVALLLNSIVAMLVTRFCFGSGSRRQPPSTNNQMTVITGEPSTPIPVIQQPIVTYQIPQVGGAYYVAPPPEAVYPTIDMRGTPYGYDPTFPNNAPSYY